MATAIFEGTGQQVAVPDYLANTHIAGNSTKIKYKLIDFGLYFLLIIIVNALTNVGLAMESVLLMTLGSVVGFLLFALAIIQLVLMLTRGQTIAFILVGARTVNFTTGQKAGGGMFLKSLLESVIGFVSFGIAPAYIITKANPLWYAKIVAALFVGAVAYRLYRFVAADKKRSDLPEGIFNGLPSPAGALIVLGATLFCYKNVILIAAVISSILMVSHIRFAHFGRVVAKNVPKPLFFTINAGIIIITAFLIKTRSVKMFGVLILGSVLLYMIIGRKFVRKICNAEKSAPPSP